MEPPTTAAYVICGAGPALVGLGPPELYAHLFVFWYALLCTITPPVCANVFIAAGIAGAPWLTVAARSMTLGLGLFLVPLSFVANPSLLTLADAPLPALLAFAKVGLGLGLVTAGVAGPRLSWSRRAAALVGGAALIFMLGL